tara:strand:+ start:200 stop:583 length:384 start_codon:yes stop_codon:yes gene_type:complete
MKSLLIGKSIKKALIETNKTDSELAKEVQVARDTIYRWRTGSTKVIRRRNLIKLASTFQLNLNYNSDGTVDFIKNTINENHKESIQQALGVNELKSIIKTLQKQIDYLMEENTRLRSEKEGLVKKKF